MKDPNITREGIVVKVGQVWRDLDVRMARSACPVVAVGAYAGVTLPGYCWLAVGDLSGPRTTRIRINRMHKGAAGWALVSEAP